MLQAFCDDFQFLPDVVPYIPRSRPLVTLDAAPGSGYSTLMLARMMRFQGTLIWVEPDPDRALVARRNAAAFHGTPGLSLVPVNRALVGAVDERRTSELPLRSVGREETPEHSSVRTISLAQLLVRPPLPPRTPSACMCTGFVRNGNTSDPNVQPLLVCARHIHAWAECMPQSHRWGGRWTASRARHLYSAGDPDCCCYALLDFGGGGPTAWLRFHLTSRAPRHPSSATRMVALNRRAPEQLGFSGLADTLRRNDGTGNAAKEHACSSACATLGLNADRCALAVARPR